MAESITITVHPSLGDNGNLTVEDAMRQVLDLIELADRASDGETSGEARVVWRLIHASTNSPFHVQAVGSSSDPVLSVDLRASYQARRLRDGVDCLMREGMRAPWMDVVALKIAKRVFDRNLNGIGRTDVGFTSNLEALHILPPDARRGSLGVEKALLDEKLAAPDYTRTDYGSVEGRIVAATTYYGNPAVTLRERLSGDRITCVLSDELASRIGFDHNLSDVWGGRRVLIGGALHYDADSTLRKIEAETLEPVEERIVELNEMRALGFAGGMRPADFIAAAEERRDG